MRRGGRPPLLSSKRHIVWVDEPYDRVLAIMPAMYDDLWTAGKGMYKSEPVVADGGEVIIYAPHVTEVSRTHGRMIEEVGYHCRDYFLGQWDRFKKYPGGILAHSTHVKGNGTYDAATGVESPAHPGDAGDRHLQRALRADQSGLQGSAHGRSARLRRRSEDARHPARGRDVVSQSKSLDCSDDWPAGYSRSWPSEPAWEIDDVQDRRCRARRDGRQPRAQHRQQGISGRGLRPRRGEDAGVRGRAVERLGHRQRRCAGQADGGARAAAARPDDGARRRRRSTASSRTFGRTSSAKTSSSTAATRFSATPIGAPTSSRRPDSASSAWACQAAKKARCEGRR